MMTREEADELMLCIAEFDDRLKALEGRVEIAENTITHIQEEYPNQHRMRQTEERLHDRLDAITDAIGELIDLPSTQISTKGKIGTRINQIETDLKRLSTTYGEDLKLFTDAMIEVKGQISDPNAKITAVERIRLRVNESKKR